LHNQGALKSDLGTMQLLVREALAQPTELFDSDIEGFLSLFGCRPGVAANGGMVF